MFFFDSHSLDVLEYQKIISILKGLCLTKYGVAKAEETAPMIDIDTIRTRLDETGQMKDIIRFGEAIPLYRLEDATETIKRSRTEGIFLEPLELLKILELIEVSSSLYNYAQPERSKFPLIAGHLRRLHPLPEIGREISKAIDRDGSILDSASPKLKKIRGDIADLRRQIINRLERILAGRTKQPGWQDDTITQRDGRYVIPMLSGQFRHDSGIVHDRSHSGATLFVEPNETVELNNRLGIQFQEERLEIDRILRKITALIAEKADDLLSNCEVVGYLDLIHAAASMSIKIDGNQPVIGEGSRFSLLAARHPLMMYYMEKKDEIVPNDISLDDSRLAIIITGPNTGGKTVALKTVGLLILMAQSGLHIPADAKSEIGIFKNIFADIGDEQSIELSLSTFSSHTRQIVYAVKNANPECLVLFDEIGAGTDPKEGASLAEAILLRLIKSKIKTIVTTHYSQLKTLPMLHPEIENASFEFDRKSLKPTYRLYTGIPGASYAVEIARRLGMPDDITDVAAELVGSGERSLTKLVESLESELSVLRRDKSALEERLKSAGHLEEYYKSQKEKLEGEIDERRKDYLKELESTLAEVRAETEKLVKEIRESKASKESVRKLHKYIKEKENKVKEIKKRYTPKIITDSPPEPGDTVWIESLQSEGELLELIGENRARVQVGSITTAIDISGLKKVKKEPDKKRSEAGIPSLQNHDTPGPEIHLRGMTVDEAMEKLDKFLDSAVVSGLTQIYVIHGKGTGTLRRVISDYLKEHRAVKSFRLGDWNEGGAGVTIVQLK